MKDPFEGLKCHEQPPALFWRQGLGPDGGVEAFGFQDATHPFGRMNSGPIIRKRFAAMAETLVQPSQEGLS